MLPETLLGDGGCCCLWLMSMVEHGSEVEQGVVEDLALGVTENGLHVLAGGEACAFVGLRHQIADVNAHGVALHNGLGHTVYQQVGDDAGKQ